MEALRDVEARLAAPRTSPLQQIIDQRRIPETEQAALVEHLQTANININASATIGDIGTQLSGSFSDAAGRTFAMGVSLGLSEPTFTDISRGLKVLLSGYGLTSLDPSRNGLQEIDSLRGDNVEIFRCETTFEREVTLPGTWLTLEKAARYIGSLGTANYLRLSVL